MIAAGKGAVGKNWAKRRKSSKLGFVPVMEDLKGCLHALTFHEEVTGKNGRPKTVKYALPCRAKHTAKMANGKLQVVGAHKTTTGVTWQ